MGSFGKALHESVDEIYRRTGIKFSDKPDAKGRYVIENFDGSIEELAERLDCVTVENAIKRLNEVVYNGNRT